jgi:hypothetical protein
MPTNYIKTNSGWNPISQIWIKVSTTWRSVSQGWINVAGTWRQFFSSVTDTYTFYLGDTVHIGTNGYISFDGGQSFADIADTTGRVLGVLPRDLVLNTVRYAADSSKFYVFWRGYRYSGGTANEIEYEVHFTNGQNYAQIKLVSFPITTYDYTGYHFNGSSNGYSRIAVGTRTVGAEYRIYFGTTAASTTPFTEYGSSSSDLWLVQSTVTAGSSDDGYITIVANQGSSAQAPTSVTASSITNTTATISWDAILNVNAGMSAIQSYRYSTDSGANWTSTGTTTSVGLTGLTANTSYTVLVRADNKFFTGTIYGSVTFSTTNLLVPGAVRNLSSTAISGGARLSWDAPTSDGGSAITRYEITRNAADSTPPTGWFTNGNNLTYDYTLTPGTWTIYVRAVNAIGNGPASSVTFTLVAPPAPVVWGAMNTPAFDRNNSLSRVRWGWNNQLPTSGSYTESGITWEWQRSTANTDNSQSASPTGFISGGTRPRRTGGGLVVGGSSYDNRVSSLSSDYSSPNNIAGANEPVPFTTAARYLRYRAVVVGTDTITYRSNYSAWV